MLPLSLSQYFLPFITCRKKKLKKKTETAAFSKKGAS